MYRMITGFAALLCLTACANDRSAQDARPLTGFEGATRLVDRGQFAEALPILRCVARQGEGFEIAEYLAGHSALALSRAAETPDLRRDDLRAEGLDRLITAGEAGWPAAQAELAAAFVAIEADRSPTQAAYWAAVYRGNMREQAYGIDRLDDDIEARIDAALTPQERATAATRAAAFTPTRLERLPMTPECAAHVRSGLGRPGASDARGRPHGGNGQSGRGPGGQTGRGPGGTN
ncbi:hypothetical protein [uncultured Maricaulis sp.]|uniref:hypothetical protein n=1 Tax=uncultured Maricaulis sp. TaxID=174710 RepID=UPI002635C550|nr:hypothetical protein [uncultured Maricaulis sp.]